MSLLTEFISQDLQRSDVIALGALLVGCLSAIYARRQADEARKSRIAAITESRRPVRLELLRATLDFCLYCGRYYTLFLMNAVNGTRDLVAEIDSFKLEVEQHGPLEMPNVEAEIKALQSMAWNLQRGLDRLGIQSSVIANGACSSDETAVQRFVDEFAARRKGLHALFRPYLNQT